MPQPRRQRATTGSARRSFGALAATIVLAGVVGASLAAVAISRSSAAAARRRAGEQATQIAASVHLALQQVDDLLESEQAFVAARPNLSNAAFVHWSASMHALQRYPELDGWGETVVVPASHLDAFEAAEARQPPVGAPGPKGAFTIVPPGPRPFYCLNRLGQARSAADRPPEGFDYCAGRLGRTTLGTITTGRVAVVPLTIGRRSWLGVVQPLYRGGVVPPTAVARRRAFLGWVGMGILPQVVLARALDGRRDTALELRARALPAGVAFRAGARPSPATTSTIPVGGDWQVAVSQPALTGSLLATPNALATLLGGIVLSLLVAALVYLLGTGRARALALVDRQTVELRHRALHDTLTGLPNRALVMDRISQLLVRTRRSLTSPALLFLDLDDFKEINDSLGHLAGDELLRAVAARLCGAVREGDTVGRLGGDEFVVIAECSLAEEGADAIVDRVTAALSAPVELPGRSEPVPVSVSIGVAVGDRALPEQLLHDADLALYRAKAAGKHRSATFRPGERAPAPARHQLEEDLRGALGREELFLVYEPVVELQGGRLAGVQARLRWRHPERGVIGEEELSGPLESTGLIAPVSAWALRQACGQAARWAALGLPVELAVDLSPRQLEDDAVVEAVASALARSRLGRHRLVLDLPESALLEMPNATSALLRRLHGLGVRIAVDQFGTGYTSVAHLSQFPVSMLKIDATVVAGATRSQEAAALLRTLVEVGRRLEVPLWAAGVATEAHRSLVASLGIELGQGDRLGEPAEAEVIEARLRRQLEAGRPGGPGQAGTAVTGPRR